MWLAPCYGRDIPPPLSFILWPASLDYGRLSVLFFLSVSILSICTDTIREYSYNTLVRDASCIRLVIPLDSIPSSPYVTLLYTTVTYPYPYIWVHFARFLYPYTSFFYSEYCEDESFNWLSLLLSSNHLHVSVPIFIVQRIQGDCSIRGDRKSVV